MKGINNVVNMYEAPKEHILGPNNQVAGYLQRIFGKDVGSYKYEVRRQVMMPKSRNKLHKHKFSETYIILSGTGKVVVGDKQVEVKPGICIFISPNTPHMIINDSDKELELISIISYEEDMTIQYLE